MKKAKPISHIEKLLFSFIFFLVLSKLLFLCFPSFLFKQHSSYYKKGAKTKMSSSNGRLFFVINTKKYLFESSCYNQFLLYIEELLTKYEAYIQVNLLIIGYKIQYLSNNIILKMYNYVYNYNSITIRQFVYSKYMGLIIYLKTFMFPNILISLVVLNFQVKTIFISCL